MKKHICPACQKQFTEGSRLKDGRRGSDTDILNHHIKPRRYGGGDDPINLIKLCRQCHADIHRFYGYIAIAAALKRNPHFFRDALGKFLSLKRAQK